MRRDTAEVSLGIPDEKLRRLVVEIVEEIDPLVFSREMFRLSKGHEVKKRSKRFNSLVEKTRDQANLAFSASLLAYQQSMRHVREFFEFLEGKRGV